MNVVAVSLWLVWLFVGGVVFQIGANLADMSNTVANIIGLIIGFVLIIGGVFSAEWIFKFTLKVFTSTKKETL